MAISRVEIRATRGCGRNLELLGSQFGVGVRVALSGVERPWRG